MTGEWFFFPYYNAGVDDGGGTRQTNPHFPFVLVNDGGKFSIYARQLVREINSIFAIHHEEYFYQMALGAEIMNRDRWRGRTRMHMIKAITLGAEHICI